MFCRRSRDSRTIPFSIARIGPQPSRSHAANNAMPLLHPVGRAFVPFEFLSWRRVCSSVVSTAFPPLIWMEALVRIMMAGAASTSNANWVRDRSGLGRGLLVCHQGLGVYMYALRRMFAVGDLRFLPATTVRGVGEGSCRCRTSLRRGSCEICRSTVRAWWGSVQCCVSGLMHVVLLSQQRCPGVLLTGYP